MAYSRNAKAKSGGGETHNPILIPIAILSTRTVVSNQVSILSKRQIALHKMPSELAQALRDIARALSYRWENLYAFLQEVVTTAIIPLATIISAMVFSWKISVAILRIVFPPTAAELHK